MLNILVPTNVQLLVMLLFLGTAHVLLAIWGRSLQDCSYYRNDVSRLESLDARRKLEAGKVFSDIRTYKRDHQISGRLFDNSAVRKLCVGIISIARPHQYLSQMLAALLSRIPLTMQDRVRLSVYNVNKPSLNNWEAISLGDLVRVVDIDYPSPLDNVVAKAPNVFTKEMVDYITAMKDLYSQGCEHVLALEDDAVAATRWAEQIFNDLYTITKDDQWYFVKYFSSFKWIGWDPEDFKGMLLLSLLAILVSMGWISIIGCVLLVAAHIKDSHKPPKTLNYWQSIAKQYWKPNLTAFVIASLGTGLFLFLLGKSNLIRYPEGIQDVSIGASMVAVLYPRENLKHLTDYLEAVTIKHYSNQNLLSMRPKDLYFRQLIAAEASKNGWRYKELVRLPNLFQHIGVKTSLDKIVDSEKTITSRTFLDDDVPITFDPLMREL